MARPKLIDQLKASGVEPSAPSGNRLINDLSKNGVQKPDNSLQKLSEGYYDQKVVDDKKQQDYAKINNTVNTNDDEKGYLRQIQGKIPDEEFNKALTIVNKQAPEHSSYNTSYYIDNKTNLPVALNYGERPPKDAKIESAFGNEISAHDDNAFTTISKSVYNGVVDVLKLPVAVADLAQGLATGSESKVLQGTYNTIDRLKMATSKMADESLVDEKAFTSVSEFFNSDNWHPTTQNVALNFGQAVGSSLQFLIGGEATGAAKYAEEALTGIQKAGKVASIADKVKAFTPLAAVSSIVNLNSTLEASKDAGLGNREGYAVAGLIASVLGPMEFIGLQEARQFGLTTEQIAAKIAGSEGANVEKALLSKTVINAFKEADGGKLTDKALKEAYKVTLQNSGSYIEGLVKNVIKEAPGEAGQELSQQVVQSSLEQLYDNVKGYNGQGGDGGFGTDITSAKAFKDYFMNAFGGALGGIGGAVIGKQNHQEQSNAIYDHIKEGKTSELMSQIQNLADNGKMTSDQVDQAKFKVKGYARYFDETKDIPLTDKDKKNVFDLTFQDENLKHKIGEIEKDKLLTPTIKEAQIKALKQRSNEIIGEIANVFSGKKEQVKSKTEETTAKNDSEVKEPEIPKQESQPISPVLPKENKESIPKSEVSEIAPKVPVSLKEEDHDQKDFSDFAESKLGGVKWNGLVKSSKADVLAEHLENKSNRKITGTLQAGSHGGSIRKYGFYYDVEIGGKRIKTASKNYIDTFAEKLGTSGDNMVDRPVVINLVKPEDTDLGELSKNVTETPEGKKAFQFKGWKGQYPYILQIHDKATGIFLGNLSVTDYGKEGTYRAPGEKIKPGKRPSVENPVLNYNTKTGFYKFENDGGDIVITDKEGIQIKGPERKNLIRKYEEQFDFTSGDRVENIPEGMYPEDVHKYIADNSNNPIEIIESYQNARKDYLQNTGTYKNQVISEGITKIKRKGYVSFGDVNNITTEMANSYFSDTGRDIDDLAMEISSDSGMTITEKDIVDFMNDFNSPKVYRNFIKETEPRYMERLRGRFNVLTGLEMNERTIVKALEQQLEKENIDFEPYLEQDFNNYEQARESYEEQLREYYDQQVNEADGAVTGDQEGTGRGKPGDEEGPAELVQKQKLSDRVQEVAGERQSVIDQLKKALPNVDVVMDSTIDGAGQLDADGKTVRLNPDYNYADTPIHEFGHVLIDITGGAKSRFNKNGIDQLKESKLWAEVAKQYPELDQDMLGKEVLATAIGNEGAIIWKAQKNKSAFRNWLDNFFIRIRDLLGIKESVAKQLARQLLSGKSLSKEMASSGKVQKQKAKIPAKGWRSWAKSAGFDVVSIEERIAEIEENSGEQVDPELDAERVELEETIKAIKEDYKEYVKDRQQVIDLAESKGDISKMDLDKLLELRSMLSKYDDITNTRFYKDMMFNIGQRINSYRIGEIKEISPDFSEKDTVGDLKKTDIFMQGLSTISERFPAIQKFYKMYRSAHNYMVGDISKLKESGDKLAQAVIKEYHKGKGIAERTKNFIVGGGHKYYAYMAKDGKFLTKESAEYNKLSKAQKELLDFILDNKDRLASNAFKNTDGYQADALLKSDAGFIETLGKSGIFRAYTNFLGKSYSLREVKVEFKNPETGKVSHEYFGDVENILEKYGKGSAAQKVHAAALVTKYNIAANKRVSMKLNSDGTSLDIKGGNSRFYMTEDGRLIGKSNNENNKNATENYYEAFMEYAKDATFSEHMSPIMPMFEGIEAFYKSQGASKENVVKFLDVVKKGKFLGETIESGLGSTIDSILRLLRKWTSWRFLAFNIPANLWNIFIGKYSNFRAQGIKESLVGEKRMFESLSKGKDNSKALNILKKFTPDLIVDTNQINPEKYAGRYFEMLAFGGLGFGETYIRGTAIIGRMSKEEYSWLDNKGNVIGSKEEVVKREKILRDNIAKYESQVDRIQGRYSDVEKRNFGYFELGRFMGQFKIWIPEWFSERFSDKYLDADNEWHKGSAGALFQFGFKDLLRDITSKEFYTSKELKYVNARKNLRGALTMGALMMLYLGASDDDDDKDMANLLNKAMRDMSFIYRMDNAAFLVATPAASMTTVTDFVKALDASFKLQKYKADGKYGDKGDLKAPGMFLKLAPGNRILDIPKELLDDSD